MDDRAADRENVNTPDPDRVAAAHSPAAPYSPVAPGGAAAPWPPVVSGEPPAAPPGSAPPGSRPGGSRFLPGALVGAVVGALVAGGIVVAVGRRTTTRTVVEQVSGATSRNTSSIARPQDIQGILAKVEPAVVAITTPQDAGTGFLISADGVLVTNNHVVAEGSTPLTVTFNDGTSKTATVLGTSPENDLAVLKVPGSGLRFAALGDSSKLQVGDSVLAIGNALALQGGLSVTEGIISAQGRPVGTQTGSTLYNMLQTDAAINPGNSGGPLVNSDGEVVGINTAIADPAEAQNVGFAIAIDTAKPIIAALRQGKAVQTAYLGVSTQDLTPSIASQIGSDAKSGAVVAQVVPGTAAAQAGLRTDDVIVGFGSTAVHNAADLGGAVRNYRPGDKVTVTYVRGSSNESTTVTLGTLPASGSGSG